MLFYSGTPAGKFSFLPLDIQKWWTAKRGEKGFLEGLESRFEELKNQREAIPKNIPFPFTGGFCGAFAYDAVQQWENIPENKEMNESLPTAVFAEYDAGMVFDHETEQMWYFSWEKNDQAFEEKKNKVQQKILENAQKESPITPPQVSWWAPEIAKEEYLSRFSSCQKALLDGRSFQINFSQKFTAKSSSHSWDIFCALVKKNPAPMMFFGEFGHDKSRPYENAFSILSCSPERLFSLDQNRTIFTQPIAGTRKRSQNAEEDENLAEELKNSAKENAEHIMLVDLLRNDFGRIAKFGSVQVSELGRIERYASVMHLVSDIVGVLDDQKTVFDLIKAVFPGGTITGAPKVETMKILAEEEKSSRNFYCGSAGYISFSGEADFNILIRTIEKEGEMLSLRVGGGLTVVSDAKQEYEETLHKARGVMGALK